MATIDLGKIKQVFRGTYNNATAYVPDDLVVFTDGSVTSTYICTTASTGNNPSSGGTAHANWSFIAKGQASSPTTTRGDLIVRGVSADERLAIGTAGQALKVNGAANGFEFGTAGGIVWFKTVRNTNTSTVNSSSHTTVFSLTYTPQDGANNKIYILASGTYGQDDHNSAISYFRISCSGQHTTHIPGAEDVPCGYDDSYQAWHSYCVFLRDPNVTGNATMTYNFQVRTDNNNSDWRPQTSMSLTVIEVASGVDQTS